MPDPRRSFRNPFELDVPGSQPIVLKHEGFVSKVAAPIVEVPAGQTRLVILDPTALANINEPTFLRAVSSVEGVDLWAIDSAAPSVDPDTVPFGWQMDLSAPDYDHVHGQLSGSLVLPDPDHDSVGTKVFHDDVFPTFLSIAEDRDYATAGVNLDQILFHDQVVAGRTVPGQSKITKGGYGVDLTAESHSTLSGQQRGFAYAWGLDGYRNFGTVGDGLCFEPLLYVADVSVLADSGNVVIEWTFASYPFSDELTNPDALPAVNGLGDAIWSSSDRMLCPDSHLTTSPSGNPGLFVNDHGGVRVWQPRNPNELVLSNGYSMPLMTKVNARVVTSSCQPPGSLNNADPVWSRITAMLFRMMHQQSTDLDARFLGFRFGPQPGRKKTLRPLAYLTSRFWSVASLPAVGLQNATDRDAVVRLDYGAMTQ